MKRMLLHMISLALFGLAIGGCFSPWEDLSYENIVPERSHYDAEMMLVSKRRRDSALFDNGMVCNVMMLSDGYYTERKGPFTVWIFMGRLMNASAQDNENIPVKSVCIKRNGVIVFRADSFGLKLCNCKKLAGKKITWGEKKLLLPYDLLTPHDGSNITVVVTTQKKNPTVEKEMTYTFRPKIERGLWAFL